MMQRADIPSHAGRVLIVDGQQRGASSPSAGAAPFADVRLDELECWLSAGDLLVVNDAATLPASLHGRSARGDAIELRLLGVAEAEGSFHGVLFGAGDFRTKTEHRPAPPQLAVGEVLVFSDLRATIASRSALSARLVELRFDRAGAALWAALYRLGHAVQYAHHAAQLPLYAVQTAYASRPWAAEMPSAGWPLRWSLLLKLRRHGVGVAAVTHAAGLSATGDPVIDAALPLPERYEIPGATVVAIEAARAAGGRVIAVGTTVVRALEGSALRSAGRLRAGRGVTDLVIDAGFRPCIVDGLLTGMHDPTESHFGLMQAFSDVATLTAAWEHAWTRGYRNHEFGDSMLVLARGRAGVSRVVRPDSARDRCLERGAIESPASRPTAPRL